MNATSIALRVVAVTSCHVGLLAASEPDQASKTQLQLWQAYYQEVANSYDLRLQSTPNERLKVCPQPVHVYRNPASGFDTHGAFFVWSRNGRAEAIGAIWSKQVRSDTSQRGVHHEFQSLSQEPFTANSTRGTRWTPRKPGITLKEIPGAPLPSKANGIRTAQMRKLAREFTGYHVQAAERQLRLLPGPLYRYEVKDQRQDGVTDGAVFAMFMDWDPEVILVIETRPTEAGPRWHFGAGRFSNRPLRLLHKGAEVWKHPTVDYGGPEDTFYVVFNVETRPNLIQE